jgi:hypothetical protein
MAVADATVALELVWVVLLKWLQHSMDFPIVIIPEPQQFATMESIIPCGLMVWITESTIRFC